jgi:hypothetical protein
MVVKYLHQNGVVHRYLYLQSVLRIRIRRIRMVLGLLDPDSHPLVRGTDPAPDPSSIKQK